MRNQIYKKKIDNTDKKIPDSGEFVKKTNYNAKITETEGKIPSITGLATTAALTAIDWYNKFTNWIIDSKVKEKQ